MLEGLEATEIKFSDVIQENQVFRIDSQYFRKQFLLDELNIHKFPIERLGNFAFITDGQHGYHEVDETSPIRHLTAKNASGWFANDIGADRIASWVDENNKRSSLKKNDLILSTRGTVGCCAIVDVDVLPANIDQDVARIKLENPLISPPTLLAYLNSGIGQDWMERNQTGMVQQGLALWRVKEMPIPLFTVYFQDAIDRVISNSKRNIFESKANYTKAETLLLDALNLAGFSPGTENSNVKSFQESFGVSGRLDAEYYQPKYEQLLGKITSQSHARLTDLVGIKKSIEPGSDAYSEDETGLPFLRVADYNKFGITKPQKRLSSTFVAENSNELEVLKPKKNTLLFSKDGSVGEAYCLREDGDFITSGAVLHLTVRDHNKILPEYLTLALNSKLVKMQAERDAGGSIILHWRVGEIENVVVPLVDMATQTQIAALVRQSFTLKAESERLLEVAKHAVEVAIEQDEQAALAYIQMRQL